MKDNPNLKNPHLSGESFFWPSGPTGVLLMHGFTATTAEIRPLAQRLLSKGYSVSGPLLPGHGTSPQDANRFTWKDWLQVCENAYRQLKFQCEPVFVGGESTGGLLALYLGSQHPEVAGILTYAPALDLQINWVDKLKLHVAAPLLTSVPKRAETMICPGRGITNCR